MDMHQKQSSHDLFSQSFVLLCLYIQTKFKKCLISKRRRDSLAEAHYEIISCLKIMSVHRYTVKVQRELELDECAIHALTEDRKRFLCKAVENYISCLLSGEEHDMWIFRLCSLWLENSGVERVNEMMKVYVCCFFSLCFDIVLSSFFLLLCLWKVSYSAVQFASLCSSLAFLSKLPLFQSSLLIR